MYFRTFKDGFIVQATVRIGPHVLWERHELITLKNPGCISIVHKFHSCSCLLSDNSDRFFELVHGALSMHILYVYLINNFFNPLQLLRSIWSVDFYPPSCGKYLRYLATSRRSVNVSLMEGNCKASSWRRSFQGALRYHSMSYVLCRILFLNILAQGSIVLIVHVSYATRIYYGEKTKVIQLRRDNDWQSSYLSLRKETAHSDIHREWRWVLSAEYQWHLFPFSSVHMLVL